jgi:catechol 2,3-dioxygenase-like lactoylglutathione lyase family enzyme
MPIRLQNVVLPSPRFEEAKAFYQHVLGLDVHAEGPGFCFLRAGGTNIAIHQVDAYSDFLPTGRGIYLDLLVDDLTVTRSSLEAESVPILKEWRDHNGDFLLVADPDGNLLEIYQARGETI